MSAATTSEWLTAAAVGTAAFLPIAAAAFAASRDLPNLNAHDLAERTRLLLALAQHIEMKEAR